MKRLQMLTLAVLAAAAVAGACGGNPPPPPPTPNADSIAMAERARADSIEAARQDSLRRAAEEAERVRRQREADSLAALARITDEVRNTLAMMVHFDFDRANIRPNDQAVLDAKVGILRVNSALRIRVSGHCDERGSDEYNLALGNRRANAVKQYLVNQGIDAGRIETLSFGEERPMAEGRTEESWAQNRRAEFEIIAGGDVLMRP